jgi:hypothetical protein
MDGTCVPGARSLQEIVVVTCLKPMAIPAVDCINRHGDLCRAIDNLAKRPDSIFLAVTVALEDEPWKQQR